MVSESRKSVAVNDKMNEYRQENAYFEENIQADGR